MWIGAQETSVVTILDSSSMNPHCWLGEGVQEYDQAHRVAHHRKGFQNLTIILGNLAINKYDW
jgi:hypothetical protein